MSVFDGKTSWVTGASSGIGAGVAQLLSERGSRVILSGRNREALEAEAEKCPGDTFVLAFDGTDMEALPQIAERASGWQGGIDLLFNNAGISQRSLAQDTDFDVYRRIMEIDFFAPVKLTQLVLPAMIERRSGHIAVTSSVAGKVGVPLRTGYCAAKHAVIGFFDALRAEIETSYGIAVSTVVPGSVQTGISRNALSGSGKVRGRSDANIENGMPVEQAAQLIVDGLAERRREILVAEGAEAQAVTVRAQHSESFFDMAAAQGKAIVEAREEAGDDWQPEPAKTR